MKKGYPFLIMLLAALLGLHFGHSRLEWGAPGNESGNHEAARSVAQVSSPSLVLERVSSGKAKFAALVETAPLHLPTKISNADSSETSAPLLIEEIVITPSAK